MSNPVYSAKLLITTILICGATVLSACTSSDDCGCKPVVYEQFSFAVISDTHVMPGEDVDNNERFVEAGRQLGELQPEIDFVFNTGDCVEDLFCHPDSGTCVDPLPALANYRNLIEQAYAMPFYFLLGNHDNRYLNIWLENEAPLASWEYVFGDSEMWPGPYYSFSHKGVLFVALFGSDLAYDHTSNDVAGFGEEQLAWLAGQLALGAPTVLLWHQYIDPLEESELAEPNPIMALIESNGAHIIGIFAGHGHRFMDREWQGVHFYQTGALKGEGDLNYHHVQFNPEDRTLEILNAADIEYTNP